MRNTFTLLLVITVLFGFAQKKKKEIVEEVEDPKITEIRNICKELDIPNNPAATSSLLIFILDWRGTPYCYGGSSKSGTDCSGFTSNLYQGVFNKSIPRVSREIYNNCMPIEKHALYEGDLVFFATGGGDRISHVGVYLWDGYFAHASSSNGVMISRLREGYYKRTFVSGGAWIDE
jgi:probable lipoprotein NlpC